MIDFVELASLGCKLCLLVFTFAELVSPVVIVVNHVGFINLYSVFFCLLISASESINSR